MVVHADGCARLLGVLDVYVRLTILSCSSARDALCMLYRSVQFMESRTCIQHRDEVTIDIVNTLIDTVVSSYLTLVNIGLTLSDEERNAVMRAYCVFVCVLGVV